MAKDVNFLKAFVSLLEETEVPKQFALWGGMCAVSCALGRKVLLDMGHFTLYPNLYVVFVAGSGKCRKSTAISYTEKMLRELEPRPNLIAQKITTEGLIDALKSRANTGQGTKINISSEGFIFASELVTLLNKQSYEMNLGTTLTDLFDCQDEFEYRTRGRGSESLTNVFLGLLGGATPETMKVAIPEQAIGEGLTSRILFIYTKNPSKPQAIPKFNMEKRQTYEFAVRALHKLNDLEGPVVLTDDAWDKYTTIYEDFYHNSPFHESHLLSGYASRRNIHLLKIAVILAACDTFSLQVDQTHVEKANFCLESIEPRLDMLMKVITTSEKGKNIDFVRNIVHQEGEVTRTELMYKVRHKMNTEDLSSITKTLANSGEITIRAEGRSIIYISRMKEGTTGTVNEELVIEKKLSDMLKGNDYA
jgi:hypothetical protein